MSGGISGCLYVWGCLYGPYIFKFHTSVHLPIHLYAPFKFECPLHPPYVCMAPYIYTSPHTFVHPPYMSIPLVHLYTPIHLYTHGMSPYICMPPVHHPICLYAIYICTLLHTFVHPHTSVCPLYIPLHMYTPVCPNKSVLPQ